MHPHRQPQDIAVGSVRYRVRISTLCKGGPHYLSAKFGSTGAKCGDGSDKSEEDVDPELFNLVLRFQRKGRLGYMSTELRSRLKDLADMWMMTDLQNAIGGLHPNDEAERYAEAEARRRIQEGWVPPPHHQLTNPFADGADPILRKGREAPVYPCLFEHRRMSAEVGQHATVPDLEAFKENLNYVTGGLLRSLDWNNLMLAGGSVLAAIMPVPPAYAGTPGGLTRWFRRNSLNGEDPVGYKRRRQVRTVRTFGKLRPSTTGNHFGESCDLDLFVYGLTTIEATCKVEQVMRSIREDAANKEPGTDNPYLEDDSNDQMLAIRTPNCVSFVVGGGNTDDLMPHVQIILRIYRTPAEILLGFDVDACCCGFDGDKVWLHQRAVRAIERGENMVDASRQSASYVSRLRKYATRGFAVAVPGLDLIRVRKAVADTKIRDLPMGLCHLIRYDKLDRDSVNDELHDIAWHLRLNKELGIYSQRVRGSVEQSIDQYCGSTNSAFRLDMVSGHGMSSFIAHAVLETWDKEAVTEQVHLSHTLH